MQYAKELEVKADHYASAFETAARICRNRLGDTPDGVNMEAVFESKAALEREFRDRLREKPIETLVEEGLIFPPTVSRTT